MLSLEVYVIAAKEKLQLTSNNQLSLKLGLSKPQVNNWLSARCLPSDETMVKLAEISGKNVEKALMHLNWWRSISRSEYAAADHYKHMIESLEVAA